MVDLSSLGERACGVWTRREALELLTAGQIDTLVRTGVWQVLWRGVYCDGGIVPSAGQRVAAAVLAAGGQAPPGAAGHPGPASGTPRRRPRAVAAGRTAARYWQLPLIDDEDPATNGREHLLDDVAVPRRLPDQSYDGRVLHPRPVRLDSRDALRLTSGVWIMTALRTLLDCADLLTHEALVCALDAALHRELVTLPELEAAAAASVGKPGGPAFRTALAVADGRAESPAETLARLLLLPVLPGLEPQVELFDDRARLVARFDLGDRAARFAVEADGKRAHAGAQMVARDRRRDRKSAQFAWTTERVTCFELRRQQAATARRVAEQYDAHVRRRAA